ncbi:unnamed protein product [Lampetra fluviatilis]
MKWGSYKYRFVPWMWLNILKNQRTLRVVCARGDGEQLGHGEVAAQLLLLLQALNIKWRGHSVSSGEAGRPVDVMRASLGFAVERAASSVPGAGTGVFVTRGAVPAHALVCLYPGTVYQKFEPVLFQSLGNPFMFCCLDGVLVDGRDRGLSRIVYRSCSGRDRLGPHALSDVTWLTPQPINPLSIGQYINNCSNEKEANVCYQEFDVPPAFPLNLRRFLPNVPYSHDIERPLRCVVLVSLRKILSGEELFSNYYTLVQ